MEQRQRLHADQTRHPVHCRAYDRHLLGNIRHGRHRQFDHLLGDRQAQVHAHGDQLLFVQSGRVRPHTACVRSTAGNVVHMVQVRASIMNIYFFFFGHILILSSERFGKNVIKTYFRENYGLHIYNCEPKTE